MPISPENLGRYIAFLVSRLCFSSVRQYLNAVWIMHLEDGLPNPMSNCWYITSILKGLRHHKGDSTQQKLLNITPDILFGILSVLDLNRPFDVTFWSECLVGFFSFFTKSNLLILAQEKFDPLSVTLVPWALMLLGCSTRNIRSSTFSKMVKNDPV